MCIMFEQDGKITETVVKPTVFSPFLDQIVYFRPSLNFNYVQEQNLR